MKNLNQYNSKDKQEDTPVHCDPDMISAAADGELTAEETQRFEEHLQICASCRKLFSEYKRVALRCRELPEIAVPEQLIESIIENVYRTERVETQEQSASRVLGLPVGFRVLSRRWAITAVAVAALVVALLSVTLFHNVQVSEKAIVSCIVASAGEDIAALDLVYSYDTDKVEIQEVRQAFASRDFLVCSRVEDGVVKISMASCSGLDLAGQQDLLQLPLQLKAGVSDLTECLRLENARAYRMDGSETSATLDIVSMPGSGHVSSEDSKTA